MLLILLATILVLAIAFFQVTQGLFSAMIMAVLSVLTIVGWVLNVVSGQMTMDQVGIDIVVQVLILIAVFGYYGKAKRVVR